MININNIKSFRVNCGVYTPCCRTFFNLKIKDFFGYFEFGQETSSKEFQSFIKAHGSNGFNKGAFDLNLEYIPI
jgi:hypothetical protein